jgi:NTP pyrophosphatase (non-canonical NTP hydrolase)
MGNLTRDEFTSAMSRLAGSVYDFHQRLGVQHVDSSSPDEEALSLLRARLSILAEEFGEHARELNRGNLEKARLELADLAFVALGSVLALDTPGTDACLEVACKNDAKAAENFVILAASGKIVRRVPLEPAERSESQ